MSLFSTRIERHTTQLVPYEKTVHEHRAPTDASVKLLTEMEEAALKRIIGTFQLPLNTLEAAVTIYDSPMDYNLQLIIQYDLNGSRQTFKHLISKLDLRSGNGEYVYEAAAKKMRSQFAEHLTDKILGDLAPNMAVEMRKLGL